MKTDMELVRIGDKVVSVPKIERAVREIIELRSKGISQQEVARSLTQTELLFPDLSLSVK